MATHSVLEHRIQVVRPLPDLTLLVTLQYGPLPVCTFGLTFNAERGWQCHAIPSGQPQEGCDDSEEESEPDEEQEELRLPLVNPLLTAPSLLDSPDGHLQVEAALGQYLGISPTSLAHPERIWFIHRLRALPEAWLSAFLKGWMRKYDPWDAEITFLWLLDAMLEDMYASVFSLSALDKHSEEFPEVAVRAGNVNAVQQLIDADEFNWDDYSRHLSEELTLIRTRSADEAADDEELRFHGLVTDASEELALDLAQQGRFDLIQRLLVCRQLGTTKSSILVALLLAGHWHQEVADLLSRHPDEDLIVFRCVRLLRLFCRPRSTWRLGPQLPIDWSRLVPLSPKRVLTAALLHAGVRGDVALVRQLTQIHGFDFVNSSDRLAAALPYFDLSVATLPEVKAKLGDAQLEVRAGCNAATVKFYLDRATLYTLEGVTPSDAVVLMAKLERYLYRHILQDYLNDISLAPTLDLASLSSIVAAYLPLCERGLGHGDRWLWRTSLRQVLPPGWPRFVEETVLRSLLIRTG